MIKHNAEDIRDGIFALHTRRFGTVAENLIKILANVAWGKNISHDLYDEQTLKKIEVKFSRALKSNKNVINESNIIEQIISADDKTRMFKSAEWKNFSFDCNIQQIKIKEFDVLYYGIFFSDKVKIFKIRAAQIDKQVKYSDKQHKGNIGEGQFHLNNQSFKYHLEHFFEIELTYKKILKLLTKLQHTDKQKGTIITSMFLLLF